MSVRSAFAAEVCKVSRKNGDVFERLEELVLAYASALIPETHCVEDVAALTALGKYLYSDHLASGARDGTAPLRVEIAGTSLLRGSSQPGSAATRSRSRTSGRAPRPRVVCTSTARTAGRLP